MGTGWTTSPIAGAGVHANRVHARTAADGLDRESEPVEDFRTANKGNRTKLIYAIRFQLDRQVTQFEHNLSARYLQRAESRELEQRMRLWS